MTSLPKIFFIRLRSLRKSEFFVKKSLWVFPSTQRLPKVGSHIVKTFFCSSTEKACKIKNPLVETRQNGFWPRIDQFCQKYRNLFIKCLENVLSDFETLDGTANPSDIFLKGFLEHLESSFQNLRLFLAKFGKKLVE